MKPPRPTSPSQPVIHLGPLELDHAPQLQAWENDPENFMDTGALNPLPEDFFQRYILSSNRQITETGSQSLGIFLPEDKNPIGYINLYNFDPIHRRVALGFYVSQGHRGKGIASQAIQQILTFAWNELRCEQVYAEVLDTNLASQHLLSHLGFEHTATLRGWQWVQTDYHDLLYFQIWHP